MGEIVPNLAVIAQSKIDVETLLKHGAGVNIKGELNFTTKQNV